MEGGLWRSHGRGHCGNLPVCPADAPRLNGRRMVRVLLSGLRLRLTNRYACSLGATAVPRSCGAIPAAFDPTQEYLDVHHRFTPHR
jgi:hypothetical protein